MTPTPTDAPLHPDLDRAPRTPSARPTPARAPRDDVRADRADRIDSDDDPVMDAVARVIGFGAIAALFVFVVLGTLGRL